MSLPSRVLSTFALVLVLAAPAIACERGLVFEDRNGNGRHDDGEPGLAGVRVSDGSRIVTTTAGGRYQGLGKGALVFVIKPATHGVARTGALPDFWRPAGALPSSCSFALQPQDAGTAEASLDVLVFADPQTTTPTEVDHYARSIVASAAHAGPRRLGLTLGDVTNDDPALYPAINAATARLDVPWLHVPGNHDLDFDAADDTASTASYHHVYGPGTYAWEEPQASVLMLDNVIHQPGRRPAYVGGLREDQFAFIQAYLASARRDRLLVVAAHVPWFDTAEAGRPATMRDVDRTRLFALLRDFPHVLLLTGHRHTQQHVFHDAASGWHGPAPLHEYNVGAASGAFWSGAADADGIPDATMADGTPHGFARLQVAPDGSYRLAWQPARVDGRDPATTSAMALHAPRVLRRGAYPAWGIYANVYMGHAETPVEFRIGDGPWQPMRQVLRPDPRLLLENARDDTSDALRGLDRSPEATPSTHLWRGALATDLATGTHRVEVRVLDPWAGEQRASIVYRLADWP